MCHHLNCFSLCLIYLDLFCNSAFFKIICLCLCDGFSVIFFVPLWHPTNLSCIMSIIYLLRFTMLLWTFGVSLFSLYTVLVMFWWSQAPMKQRYCFSFLELLLTYEFYQKVFFASGWRHSALFIWAKLGLQNINYSHIVIF